MNTINVNAQNGVASSAVKNLEVVVYYGDTREYGKDIINVDNNFFERSLNASVYTAVVSGKKDMWMSVKFNGADEVSFRLVRDYYSGKYTLVIEDCEHGSEDLEIEFDFTRVAGKNVDAIVKEIEGYIYNVMESIDMVAHELNDIENKVLDFNDYVLNTLMTDYDDAVGEAEVYADTYGEHYTELPHLSVTLDYDYDIRKMWADWCWENDVLSRDDAYKYYDDNSDMFINEDDLDNIVEGLDSTYNVENGVCLVWVKNPYYVEQEQVENDSPYLDDVDRVVKVIEGYVNNYEGMLMDYDGNSASICVPWDVFNEDDMKMLIEDEVFEACVVGVLMGRDIKDVLVYDDGVYVSVDAKMFDRVA